MSFLAYFLLCVFESGLNRNRGQNGRGRREKQVDDRTAGPWGQDSLFKSLAMYGQIILIAIRRQYAYRTAALAGLITTVFWGLFRAYLFQAVRGERHLVAGYDAGQLFMFVAFTQAILPVLDVYRLTDLARTIRTGEVIMDICKPVGFYGLWLARDLGRAVFQLFSRGVPLMIFFGLVFHIQFPSSPVTWMAFLASLLLAVLISFAWRFLYSAAAFWVIDIQGVANLAIGASTFLMGFLVPVSFFPAWLKAVARSTPFPSMVDTPLEILAGVCTPDRWAGALLQQAFWLVIVTLVARMAVHFGLRKVVIQGG